MKMLVTGGAGFIGSHVVDALSEIGHEVVSLDDLSGGFTRNIPNTRLYRADVTDMGAVDYAVETERPDVIFHLAAYAAEVLSHHIRHHNYRVNLLGTANVINAAVNHGVRRIVFASSIAALGDQGEPIDPYGVAKLASEMDLRAATRHFGIEHVIFRLHNVYGERQNLADKYRNVIGIWMNQIMRGERMRIFGDGKQTRAFTYIQDIMPAFQYAGLFAYQTHTLGTRKQTSINDLAKAVRAAMGVPDWPLEYVPARNETHTTDVSTSTLYGGRDTPLADGLARMAEWARACGAQNDGRMMAIEVARNLPSAWANVT